MFKRRFNSHIVEIALILLLTTINFGIDQYAGLISAPAMIVKITISFVFFFCAIFEGKIHHIGLMFIICVISMAVADLVAAFSLAAVFRLDSFEFIMVGFNRLGFVIVAKTIFIIFSKLVLSRFKDLNRTDPRSLNRVILVLLFDVIFIVLAHDIYLQNKSVFESDLPYIVGVTVGTIALSIMVVRMTESIVTYALKEKEWQLQEDEYNRQIFYLNHLEDINHQMKSIRHDFNHHIGCLHGMLEQGNLDQAKEYSGELVHEAEKKFNVAFSSEHPGISGLLSSKYQIMRDKGIDLQWTVNLPDSMNIKLIDLSVILGNALDNAIEAVEVLDETERNIELKIYFEMDYLVIKTSNKFREGVLEYDFSTTKEDVENHGYGLGNIKFVVSKYDGILKIETKNNEFSLNVALPNVIG